MPRTFRYDLLAVEPSGGRDIDVGVSRRLKGHFCVLQVYQDAHKMETWEKRKEKDKEHHKVASSTFLIVLFVSSLLACRCVLHSLVVFVCLRLTLLRYLYTSLLYICTFKSKFLLYAHTINNSYTHTVTMSSCLFPVSPISSPVHHGILPLLHPRPLPPRSKTPAVFLVHP